MPIGNAPRAYFSGSFEATAMRFTPSAASWRAISGVVISPSSGSPSMGWPPVIATAPFTSTLKVMFTPAATQARIESSPLWK